MKFERESLRPEFFDEAAPLIAAHHEEISAYSDRKLSVSRDMYAALEASGSLGLFTARDAKGTLLGYAIFVLSTHIHYADMKVAEQLALYIKREARGFGWSFMRWINKELATLGIDHVVHHVPADSDLSSMLIREGFEFMEVVYRKNLKESA